jgi:DNA-directed RNA polymerase specialized sigma24 family protein
MRETRTFGLSAQEAKVVQLILFGFSKRRIAARAGLPEDEVERVFFEVLRRLCRDGQPTPWPPFGGLSPLKGDDSA